LAVGEEVEDICGGSGKELQIETKLKTLSAQWLENKFTFQHFKQKGAVILQAKELGEACVHDGE
jgi:hypothetical protein